MNPTQAENLRILIRHMETNVRRTLDMSLPFDGCGTPACAMGEASTIAALGITKRGARKVCGGGHCPQGVAAFGLSDEQTERIFGMGMYNAWHRSDVTPTEWALEARKVLAENGYAMDIPTIAERIAGVVSGNVMTPDDIAGTRIQAFEEKMQTAYYDFPQVRK